MVPSAVLDEAPCAIILASADTKVRPEPDTNLTIIALSEVIPL